MIKVNLISGFLGAGKTTLIKKILENVKEEKVIIIENEIWGSSYRWRLNKKRGL